MITNTSACSDKIRSVTSCRPPEVTGEETEFLESDAALDMSHDSDLVRRWSRDKGRRPSRL